MENLPNLGKCIQQIQDVFIKRRHGKSGFVIGSILILLIIVPLSAVTLASGIYIKNSLYPAKSTLGVNSSNPPVSTVPTLSLTPTTTVTPQPNNSCEDNDFSEQFWDTSQYNKDTDNYYIPKAEAGRKFLFPKLTYKNKMSALFKEIHLEYIATYQNQNSTQSATLFLALYDSQNNIVFEVNMPEPNRQLIALKKSGSFSDAVNPITPIPISPIILPKRISFTGTHGITLAANKSIDDDNKVNYSITGEYINAKGDKEPFSGVIPSKVYTVDPTIKAFTLVIGTERKGKLKIEKINICDRTL